MLDFHYVTVDEDDNEQQDQVKHDHVCDDCGDTFTRECTEGCDETEEEYCEDCKIPPAPEEE